MKKTKLALIHSLIALLLCASMFVGTTFAWFTDEVTSANNIIQSGTLDVKLEWRDKTTDDWREVTDSKEPIFNYTLWEPGYTQVKYIKITNAGNLAFKFRLNIVPNADFSKNDANLADVIDVYLFDEGATIDRDAIAQATPVGTLTELMTNSTGAANGVMLPAGSNQTVAGALTGEATYCIVLKMQETAGNEYQDKSVGNGFSLQLLATQYTYEEDSFGSDYDNNATYRPKDINFTASTSIANLVANNTLTQAVTVGDEDGIKITFPAGVLMEAGAESAGLSVETLPGTNANIELGSGESMVPMEITAPGVAKDNTVPMQITIPALMAKNLNFGNAKMYHLEDGKTVEMVQVATLAELDEHNEFYYDSVTGDVVLNVATFSEYVAVTDNLNPWNGEFDYLWYNAEAKELTIMNADQLAAFGKIVDGTAPDIAADTFEGQTVKLGKDVNLGGTISFNPIGFGYDYAGYNAGDVKGQTFNGIFDGDGHTISGLYQSGWELGYSYTNCGGGLFASVCDATIKDLTISGAEITFECVEIGVVAGLAQGTCEFENINIYGCKIANYQRATGGVVGEVSPRYKEDGTLMDKNCTHTFKNVNIDATTTVGSLWGDFDCPVGGVIGARWDDANITSVNMTNVNVACRLDVYNDVTSSYQWYAYRRAGMLIGNTDEPGADGKNAKTATATFLTCENVVVYYGDWVNYHYCEFNNGNPSWPWVRAEAGENCNAYSNPRYGQPVIDGVTIQDSLHSHTGDDEHLVLLSFNQLYGGGQGVYGAENHYNVNEDDVADVTFGKYTITYIDHGEVFHADYATDNYTPTLMKEDVLYSKIDTPTDSVLTGWMDNFGNTYDIDAPVTFTADTILYPLWSEEKFVMCFDMNNILVYSELLTGAKDEDLDRFANNINATLKSIQEEVDSTGKVIAAKWQKTDGTLVDTISASDLQNAKEDLILIATPELKEGSIKLEKVYDETTGEHIAYKVSSVVADNSNVNVVIPGYVGTYPVTIISDNAAAGFNNLHSITIPVTITSMGSNAFASTLSGWGDTGETITIYFKGTPAQWESFMDTASTWGDGLGDGSRIFFLNKNNKVDADAGYWEYDGSTWQFHDHEYTITEMSTCKLGAKSHYEYAWSLSDFKSALRDDRLTDYAGNCDCDDCEDENGNPGPRPDQDYWPAETTTE